MVQELALKQGGDFIVQIVEPIHQQDLSVIRELDEFSLKVLKGLISLYPQLLIGIAGVLDMVSVNID